jgi:hypothetical protein
MELERRLGGGSCYPLLPDSACFEVAGNLIIMCVSARHPVRRTITAAFQALSVATSL